LDEEAMRSAAATANSLGLPTTKVSKVKRGSKRAPKSSSAAVSLAGTGDSVSLGRSTAGAAGNRSTDPEAGDAVGRTLSAMVRTAGLIEVQSPLMRSA